VIVQTPPRHTGGLNVGAPFKGWLREWVQSESKRLRAMSSSLELKSYGPPPGIVNAT
jgi:hypothetical protein